MDFSPYQDFILPEQQQKISQLMQLFPEINQKVNLISRKDIDSLFEKHILHSLSIAKFVQIADQSLVMDLGTGGGFPGIPLAIMFPKVQFHLIDSIQKKINCVEEIARTLDLKNVKTFCTRAEKMHGPYDFVVSRAVAPVRTLLDWTRTSVRKGNNSSRVNGWIFLKGGNLTEEMVEARVKADIVPVQEYFNLPVFDEKVIVYVKRN
jgi:16S rRNA (guanine527-N7)-methyltransferase